ncbi:Hypp1960 [Branchiostoma lanceolatum]|uniref:Hypp1960 protein n=1 Tax=Branchiostoma lanceolatum TaxID=7740 RepID=A0A8J9ZNR7_BRALA|nr:Hypp1960 [Branchiostoma lanceolatum]
MGNYEYDHHLGPRGEWHQRAVMKTKSGQLMLKGELYKRTMPGGLLSHPYRPHRKTKLPHLWLARSGKFELAA